MLRGYKHVIGRGDMGAGSGEWGDKNEMEGCMK